MTFDTVPTIADNQKLAQEAAELAELFSYYAELLLNPNTTALHISAICNWNFDTKAKRILLQLIPEDELLRNHLVSQDPDFVEIFNHIHKDS